MSASNTNTNTETNANVVVVVATKAPRVKKPALVAKYSKHLIFGYSLVQSLHSKGLLTDEGVEAAYVEIKLMASVEDQTQFYESMLSQQKGTGALMRKFIAVRNKPPKAPKAARVAKPAAEKKTRAPKKAAADTAAPAASAKAPRAKKATRVTNDATSDIVADLVEAANADTAVQSAAPPIDKKADKEAKDAAKTADKEAKDAAKTADKEAKAKKAKEAKEAKEAKAKKADTGGGKGAKKAPAASVESAATAEAEAEAEAETEECDEEIHTQEVVINGQTYLIDTANNLYSSASHEQVGTYNAETNAIVAC
jgi:hypothetical protein